MNILVLRKCPLVTKLPWTLCRLQSEMSTIIIEKDETNSLDKFINSIRQKIDIANEGIGGV